MDSRISNVFLNAAVCLYAIIGFSLSVLTSLPTLLRVRQPINVHPRKRPITRTLRVCSDKPSTPAPLPKSTEPTLEDKHRRRKMLAAHRRSRSIPLITLDYFGSTENLHTDSDLESSSLPVRKPLTFVLPPPPARDRMEPPWSADYDSEKSSFRLASLFSKEKRREKENVRKVTERRTPSPPPSQHLGDSARQPQAPRKRRKSDVSKRPLLSKQGQDRVLRAPVRRVSSAPTEERLTMKFDLTFCRTIEKKKSSTLRTQPYEAPFFCPPPVQAARLKSRSALDLTSKSHSKPPRSSTMRS